MKSTITIQGSQISVSFAPETELERLSLAELGDDVSVSRAHQCIVLKPRRANILKFSERLESESSTGR